MMYYSHGDVSYLHGGKELVCPWDDNETGENCTKKFGYKDKLKRHICDVQIIAINKIMIETNVIKGVYDIIDGDYLYTRTLLQLCSKHLVGW